VARALFLGSSGAQTSDLSTNESSHENDNNKEHNSGNKQMRRVCQQEVLSKKSLWSPGSSDIFGKIILKLIVRNEITSEIIYYSSFFFLILDDSDTDPHYTYLKLTKVTYIII